MGLRLEVPYGGAVGTAYARVTRPTISIDIKRVGFDVFVSTERGAEPHTYEHHTAPYDLDGANPFIQAYMYLKTLPEYSTATDVTED